MQQYLFLALLLPLLFLAACGEKKATDSLQVISYIGPQEIKTIDLDCQESCQSALTKVELEPVPRGALCTKIYGGPEEIQLQGNVAGQEIRSRFSRSGGCEITRFESLKTFFRAVEIDYDKLFPRPTL